MHGTYNIKIHFCVLQYQQDTTIHTHSTSRQYKNYNNQAVPIIINVHKVKVQYLQLLQFGQPLEHLALNLPNAILVQVPARQTDS